MAFCRALLLSVLCRFICGQPQAAFPVNSQVPPVARVNEPYTFQFSQQTFVSSSLVITYTLADYPDWLRLDPTSRTLFGLPTANDLGPSTFELQASDQDGIAKMQLTLVVVDTTAPSSSVNVTSVLAKNGSLTDGSTLAVYPTDPFSIVFGSSVFRASSQALTYYATSSNRSPLPSWITFDPLTVAFTGQTPAPATSPRRFDISLYATTVPGFAESTLSFAIEIADHQLAFTSVQRMIDTAAGLNLSVSLANDLLLDGRRIAQVNVSAAQVAGPSWLSINPQSLVVSGQAPQDFEGEEASVSVQDVYNNNATTTLHLRSSSSIFRYQIGTVKAFAGRFFIYQLPKSLFADFDVTTSISFGGEPDWLHFSPSNMSIEGNVPENIPLRPIAANLTAISNSSNRTESQVFSINITQSDAATSSQMATKQQTRTAAPTAASTSQNALPINPGDFDRNRLTAGEIAAAVVIPVIALATLLVILCLFCHRKRKLEKAHQTTICYSEQGRPNREKISAALISRPLPSAEVHGQSQHAPSNSWETDNSFDASREQSTSSSGLVQVGLPGASLGLENLARSDHSSLHEARDTLPESLPVNSAAQPARRRGKRESDGNQGTNYRLLSRVEPNDSKRNYSDTADDGGGPLFDRRRIVPGLGHGRVSYGADSTASTGTEASFSYAGTSVLSRCLSSHEESRGSSLQSNQVRGSVQALKQLNRRSTLRMVSASDSIDARRRKGPGRARSISRQRLSKRQSYNPFFASSAREFRWGSEGLQSWSSRTRSRASMQSARHSTVSGSRPARGQSWQEGFPRVIRESSCSQYSVRTGISRSSLFADAEISGVRMEPAERPTLAGRAEKGHESVSVVAKEVQQHPLRMHRRGPSRGEGEQAFL